MPFNNYFTGAGLDAIKQDFIVYQGDVLPTNTSVFDAGDVFWVRNEQKFYRWNGANWVQVDGSALDNVALTSQSNTFASSQIIQGDLTVVDVNATSVSASRVDVTSGSIDVLSGSRVDFASGSVDVISGSRLDYASGSIDAFNATTANVASGVITALSGSRVDYVSGSIDALSGTTVDFVSGSIDTFTANSASITTGQVTTLSGSRVDYASGDIASASVDRLYFDVSAAVDVNVGEVAWNDTSLTLDVGLKNDVTLQVGQENLIKVRNDTSASIPNGSVVYVTGALGNRPTVALACANAGAACSGKVLGITTETLDVNEDGFVTTQGQVRGLNTNVDGDGTTLIEGDTLYLSTTPGEWVKTIPTPPDREVVIGYVTRKNLAQGQIFVSVDNGRTLENLHDVALDTPAGGDVLVYDGSTSVWQSVSQSDVDAGTLDGEEGAYYLDWANTTDKPDPTITLAGDLTGSVTLTDVTSGTLSASVTQSGVTQHEAALTISASQVSDFTSATQTVVSKAYVDSLNVDADTLDGQDGTYYVDFTNATNVPDPTITLTGDVTGSVTLTDLTSGSLAATVTQSGVTQHEAALSVTESQVSDLDKYSQSVVDSKDAAVEASAVAFAIALG